MNVTNNGAGLWLWVDPAREAGYNSRTFDQAAFLARAVAVFRSKPTWNGDPPNAVKTHPDDIASNGLGPVATALGLRVIADPLVAPETYRLGIATDKRGGDGDGT